MNLFSNSITTDSVSFTQLVTDSVSDDTSPPQDDTDPPDQAQSLIVGCSLAVCGNIVISVSLNLQKYTHMRLQDTNIHYTHFPLWWLGVTLMALGEVGNFSAYGFSPASLVAPLGTTTVVANLLIAAIFLKESIRPQHVFGSTLAIFGAILLVTFSKAKENVLTGEEIQEYMKEPILISYICVELALLALLMYLLYGRKVTLVIIYLLIASLLASFTVMSAKGLSSMLQLSIRGYPQFQYPIFWVMLVVMVVTAVVQIKYLNMAMKGYDATVVVPTNFVFFTISAILAGIIFYKEFKGMTAVHISIFLFGCVLCFVGVYFITARSPADKPPPPTSPHLNRTISQISQIIPAWLTASVHTSPVQPGDNAVTLPDDTSSGVTQPLLYESSDDDTYAPNLPPITIVPERSVNPDYGTSGVSNLD